MARYGIRGTWVSDVEQLRRLAKRLDRKPPSAQCIVKSVKLTGRVGLCVTANADDDSVIGFVLGVIEPPALKISWLVGLPEYRNQVFAFLLTELMDQYPHLDLLIRVPNGPDVYEELKSLRTVTKKQMEVLSGANGMKVDDAAEYVEVRVPKRPEPPAARDRSGSGSSPVEQRSFLSPRPGGL